MVQVNTAAARKELGMGLPPEAINSDIDAALAMEIANACAPINARENVQEVARWEIQTPVADAAIAATFNNVMNVWGTPNAQPPNGVAAAQNTNGTPGQLSGNNILFGWRIRLLTEPETRRIAGNCYTPPEGSLVLPASVDVATLNDIARALNIPGGQEYLEGEFLYGLPTWRIAYALVQAYNAVWKINEQEILWKEPLTTCSIIEPFAEAEAAGLAYTTNQDVILAMNRRYAALGIPSVFLPEKFVRTGSVSQVDGNAGLFSPSRSEDAAQTIFGGLGVPQDGTMKKPYYFSQPIFWPRGQTMTFQFEVNANTIYQAEMQRWLSVTGGANGQAGQDLNLPFSDTLSGVMPSALGADTTLELTDDVAGPVLVGQQVNTNQQLRKGGRLIMEVSLIAKRCPPAWSTAVLRAIQANVIQAPLGTGDLRAQ